MSLSIHKEMKGALATCDQFLIANASLSTSVLEALDGDLRAALGRGATGAFIIGIDLGTTEPKALERLRALAVEFSPQLQCRVFQLQPKGIFHPKVAIFRGGSPDCAIVGSSNLSRAAAESNIEVDILVLDPTEIEALASIFNGFLADICCHVLTEEVIQKAREQAKVAAAAKPPKPSPNILIPPRKYAGPLIPSPNSVEYLRRRLHALPKAQEVVTLKLKPDPACRLVDLEIVGKDLTVTIYPADIMSQGQRFFRDVDPTAFLALRGAGWQIWPNFHLIYRGNGLRVDGRKTAMNADLEKYFNFWLGHQELLAPIDRGTDGFTTRLQPYVTPGLLTVQNLGQVGEKFGGIKEFKKIYPCPGLGMRRSWKIPGELFGHELSKLSEPIASALAEGLATFGQKLGFAEK